MWDLPGPGIEPVSPALAGGFLTTAPPGKSPTSYVDSPACHRCDVVVYSITGAAELPWAY